jgi:hypothetical protein
VDRFRPGLITVKSLFLFEQFLAPLMKLLYMLSRMFDRNSPDSRVFSQRCSLACKSLSANRTATCSGKDLCWDDNVVSSTRWIYIRILSGVSISSWILAKMMLSCS